MRILHASGWLAPRYGGSTAVVLQSAANVAARGHDVEIITTNVDGPGVLDVATGRAVEWAGVTTTFHPLSMPRRFLTSWSMLADLQRRVADFDIVHVHSLYRFHTIAAAVSARRQRVPYVIQAHGSLDPWHRHQKRRAKDVYHLLVEDEIIRGAAAVLCTSELEQQSIRDLGYATPTWVIPIGIDTGALRTPASTGDLLTKAGIDPNARIVTFLGRISAKKGVDLLVESFRQTGLAFPDAHLVIAGPDDERIGLGLGPIIARGGLAGRVSFVGEVAGADKAGLLQRSTVFVLPSADESFGIAVAEAMAVGCPVVVSPYVGIEGVVRTAGAGFVAERDPLDVARAVGAIMADPALAAKMGQSGKRAVDEHYTWSRVGAELESMYRAVAEVGQIGTNAFVAGSWHGWKADLPDQPRLACPVCRGPIRMERRSLVCGSCGQTYRVVDGIPILTQNMALVEDDEIDHLRGGHLHGQGADTHKTAQADHFDRAVAEEFEITRPHGTPLLYRFLLHEKLRRATSPIRPHLRGVWALTVCGGSGMDAEFLARAGAHVVSADLSLGAARRTRERASRYGLPITPIVADVECLPFVDRAFDLVLVHDGLHHLERPEAGLAEMARVARRWVSVSEPAQSAATAVAVRAGVAREREEAGNWVARLTPTEVVGLLAAAGFRALVAERYAMYYHHQPGPVFKALSRRRLLPFMVAGWRVTNTVIGRFGNKMVAIAERQTR